MRYIAAILTVCLTALVVQKAVAEESEYIEIRFSDLKQAIADKKVTLIDCNGTQTFENGHIPGAIDLEASRDKLAELLPKNKDVLIVSYCGGGNCPKYKHGAAAAIKLGYTNVKFYGGGMHAWKSAGEKVASSK
jgi:rhodanese-related sulfurtransferase